MQDALAVDNPGRDRDSLDRPVDCSLALFEAGAVDPGFRTRQARGDWEELVVKHLAGPPPVVVAACFVSRGCNTT